MPGNPQTSVNSSGVIDLMILISEFMAWEFACQLLRWMQPYAQKNVHANTMVLDAKQKREVKHGTCFQADFHAAFLYVYVDFSFYTLQLLCSPSCQWRRCACLLIWKMFDVTTTSMFSEFSQLLPKGNHILHVWARCCIYRKWRENRRLSLFQTRFLEVNPCFPIASFPLLSRIVSANKLYMRSSQF